MAQLIRMSIEEEKEWQQLPNESFEDYCKRTEQMYESLEKKSAEAVAKNQAVGFIIHIPIADGYARYLVVKERPLTLVHIPFGDAWRAPEAHIRGLRLIDVKSLMTIF